MTAPMTGSAACARLTALSLPLERSNFFEPPQMTFRAAELGLEIRRYEFPGDRWSDRAATQTDDVDVIVLNALPRREGVVDQRRAHTRNLVGAHGCADAAAADRNASLHQSGGHRLGQRDREIGIIVIEIENGGAEVDYVVAGATQTPYQLFLECEAAVIGCDSHALA